MTSALTATDQATLLQIAREALRAAVARRAWAPDRCGGALADPSSAFVTLTLYGDLRGCIGSLDFDRALGPLVAELTASSALRDPRFPPLHAREEPDARIEISVLEAPFAITPDAVLIGRHGLIVERGRRRGLLLPQVAVEHRLTRERFLDATCRKAGLPPRAWCDGGVRLSAFEAVVFGEAR